ncbi:Similar to S.cerevisiae protein IST1 (Protein with positive role in the multivesicular body sorting pathway) [Malassezia sympodialis ATCC 42132]|uniref:Similar to S.cerevisiae protein IST1 (Protein with positive role in the multivesicular body sorting pathway) n=1 Tax=Malassezia sympodialis (strain ATCC 42132) TaxID=1230383 RepID=A0A1M8A657_MALS4|nr:Similar to S.cerevisiae protein IST1 (Protein with positive role in the multivesicular body sorting pathway) [Malassezia sympodialis ATCC 42132]
MARWHAARTRIQLKLAIQRVHMLQEKREALAKRARLHISELVGRGRMETARVKTESLTLDDIHTEVLELLELYCEMLYARFALLEHKTDEPDPAIREPLMAVLHAAHRTEVQELHVLQDMLCARYGAEVAQAALDNQDGCVPERITVKVAYHVPPPELVNAYLREICHAYGIALPGEAPLTGTETADAPTPSAPRQVEAQQGDEEWGALMKRFEALKRP